MRLKKRYGLQHDRRYYCIDIINDQGMCIKARNLASKVVRKNFPIQCNLGYIVCRHKCGEGVQMNWLLFLMNQLVEDVMAVQAGEQSFTYSWLLILITLMAWMEPDDFQGMEVEAVKFSKGARYQNLWWVREPEQLKDCVI